ncbi:hypothetical protein LXL04_015091 [Taraxacum kok-saghyz]
MRNAVSRSVEGGMVLVGFSQRERVVHEMGWGSRNRLLCGLTDVLCGFAEHASAKWSFYCEMDFAEATLCEIGLESGLVLWTKHHGLPDTNTFGVESNFKRTFSRLIYFKGSAFRRSLRTGSKMEIKSPAPCPKTVTVRRNPPRRARPTPSTVVPISAAPSSKTSSAIRSFPIHDILSIDIPEKEKEKQEIPEPSSPKEPSSSEKLKVFLRIKPIITQPKVGVSVKNAAHKNVWPQNPSKKKDASKTAKAVGKKSNEICLKVNDSHSVTLCPPQSLADARRTKSEVYEGFSHVFCADSSQSDVYDKMVNPLVDDFLNGKSGMIAAMGPSGSGKTHTVFGSSKEPGMVPLALRQIFSGQENNRSKASRTFYLSMFEIYSERGKGEKIMDLSQEGGDLFMQQSTIKGLKETIINDFQQAEALIASGMLKRSTAMTNSNIQSSRSQCIINIRSDINNIDFHSSFQTGPQSCPALLTIVDLAGAEREKKTGNQGARLLESNFINNTSMVFGLCLRSLLEHQRNPKKPFHKHFQNSLLTKYLRDFLEGKKRMALILTAKSGEDDYQDTSYMLRQASPFMNIKFENVEEQPTNAFKKRTQTLPKAEQSKRMKLNNSEVCLDGELKGDIQHQILKEELTPEKVKETDVTINDSVKKAREHHILLNLSRVFWKFLKEYKNKLEASEKEVHSLRHSLKVEKEKSCSLESELNLIKSTVSDVHEGTSSIEAVSTSISGQICQEQSEGKDDVAPNEYVVFDKGDLKELEDKNFSSQITGCDVITDSDLHIQEDEKEEGLSCGEEVSESSGPETYEEQSKNMDEKVDIPSTNGVSDFDKQELKEVDEKEENGETSGCDGLAPGGGESDVCVGLEDEVSSSPLVEPKQEEKEGISPVAVISISSDVEKLEEQCKEEVVLFDKQEIKEDKEIAAANGNEISSTLEEGQPQQQQDEKQDIPDPKLVCPVDVIKLTDSSNIQPNQKSSAVKPKRRLRPASSVMLRNINVMDSFDETEMPKHGKRGGEKDDGGKRTQGSISLMRILKQNMRH